MVSVAAAQSPVWPRHQTILWQETIRDQVDLFFLFRSELKPGFGFRGTNKFENHFLTFWYVYVGNLLPLSYSKCGRLHLGVDALESHSPVD